MESPFWAEGPSFFTGAAPNYGYGGTGGYAAQTPQVDTGQQGAQSQVNGYAPQGAGHGMGQAAPPRPPAQPGRVGSPRPSASADNTGNPTVAKPTVNDSALGDFFRSKQVAPVYTVSKGKGKAPSAGNVFGPTWW